VACLVALLSALAEAGRSMPTIGDALEYGSGSPNYLKKNTQSVGIISPLSGQGRRLYDKELGVFTGPNRRRGIIWWSKKRSWNPFSSQDRAPFKVRLLKENPTGVMLTLAEEGKLELSRKASKSGEVGLSVKLVKPKPWWRGFL